MKIKVKNLAVGSVGIEFEVRNSGDEFLGDLFVTNAGLIWCKGKTSKANGVQVKWGPFIEWMEGDG